MKLINNYNGKYLYVKPDGSQASLESSPYGTSFLDTSLQDPEFKYDGDNITNSDSKCLDLSLQFTKCDDSIEQSWTLQNDNYENNDDYSRQKYKGKYVVLVDESNPWYLNKDITTVMNYIPPQDPLPSYSLMDDFIAAKNLHVPAYVPESNTEHFASSVSSTTSYINILLITFLLIVICLIIYTRYF